MYKHSPLLSAGYNRLVGFRAEAHSPRSNIVGSVNIGIFGVPAGGTLKNALTLPVASGYVAAFTALSRSIFRVNNKNLNALKLGFVLDKLSQLKEAPRVMPGSLAFSNRCAAPDTLKIFNGDIGVCA